MFKHLTLLIIFTLFHHIMLGQLTWSNPQPSGYINNKIVFTDANNGFIFNSNGDLIRTRNQGTTWQNVHNFYNTTTFDIHDSTGVIGGYGLLYISSDNGNTWQKKVTGIADNFSFIDIVSRDTIFLAGTSKIYKTFNRGLTWQTLNLGNIIIKSLDFVNSKLGFVGKSNTSILKTTDGGLTWQESTHVSYAPSGILAIKFLNPDTGYAYREYDSVLKTTNSGVTWKSVGIGDDIYTINFPNDSIGYMAGENGAMYRTSNGGNTWTWIGPGGRVYATEIYSLCFINADTGFAVGHRGRILKTTNGGTTWQTYSPTYTDIMGLSFPGANTGYAVTWNNSFKTTDGAKTWTPLSLVVGTEYASNSRFENAHFFSPDTGFLSAGYPARLYKTYNGGQTWRTINPSAPYGYDHNTGLSFVNDSTAFLSLNGPSGVYALFKTKDRAENWKKIDSSHYSGEFFTLVNFLDERTGYGVRYSQLYKTDDSVKTWKLVYSNNNYQIQAICFLDAGTGFMGDDQGLKRTSDSGHTWISLNIDYFDRNILSIKFLNSKIGYFTSAYGAIYQTIDGGLTWVPYGKAASYDCGIIEFCKDSLVYFGGIYGTIVRAPTDSGFGTPSNCQGNNFIFISDVVSNSYHWEVNRDSVFISISDDSVYSGAGTNALTVNNPPGSWAGYKYRCVVSTNNITKYSKIHELKFQTQWTGAVDAAWENPDNWSCRMVPDANTDVIIYSGSVILNSSTTIRSLKLSPGASFTVNAGYTLTIIH